MFLESKIFIELTYRKIPKISPGAYIFQRPFLRGLYLEGLIYGGFFCVTGLGAYTWRGLFSGFYVISIIGRISRNIYLNVLTEKAFKVMFHETIHNDDF